MEHSLVVVVLRELLVQAEHLEQELQELLELQEQAVHLV